MVLGARFSPAQEPLGERVLAVALGQSWHPRRTMDTVKGGPRLTCLAESWRHHSGSCSVLPRGCFTVLVVESVAWARWALNCPRADIWAELVPKALLFLWVPPQQHLVMLSPSWFPNTSPVTGCDGNWLMAILEKPLLNLKRQNAIWKGNPLPFALICTLVLFLECQNSGLCLRSFVDGVLGIGLIKRSQKQTLGCLHLNRTRGSFSYMLSDVLWGLFFFFPV